MRPAEIAPGETFVFPAAMLRTERMTQQLSRLSDPVESCGTSRVMKLQEKFWTDGSKSQEGAECNFAAGGRTPRSGAIARGSANRFKLKRLRRKTVQFACVIPRPSASEVAGVHDPVGATF